MKHILKSILIPILVAVVTLLLVIQTIAFFISGPMLGTPEDKVYFYVFVLLWLSLGILISSTKKLTLARAIAFIILFILFGIIVRGVLEILIIPAAISMAIWSFKEDF